MTDQLQQIALERGGKCLSDTYKHSQVKLLWECVVGHRWEATPNNIKRGAWCPYCVKMAKLTIEEMNQIAKERGGRCISSKYKNNSSNLTWECEKGHRWEATPNSIKHRTWCPYCAKKIKLTIEEMRQIAKERSGKCLSSTYIHIQAKLLWECAKGHQWEATPANIKRGNWCPNCSKRIKRTIEEMRQIAKERGGKCLSDTYINNATKLLWECSGNHQWEAVPNSLLRGTWCPLCNPYTRNKRKYK